MNAPLGLTCLLAVLAPEATAEEEGIPELEVSAFRAPVPNRELMLGFGPTLGDKLYSIGSPAPAHWAPEFGARFLFGSWRFNLVVHGAVAPLVPLKGSIAESRRGTLLEGGLAFRAMPVLRRVIRVGLQLGAVFDQVTARVDLAEEDGGTSGRKRVGHVSPELGIEFAFPVVGPRADRPWSMDVFLAAALRLAGATRTTLRIEDESGETETRHLARELTVIGPFAGALLSARLGLTLHYDLVTARKTHSSSSGQ